MALIIYLIWNKLTEAICAEDSGFFSLSRSCPRAAAKVKCPGSQHTWQSLRLTSHSPQEVAGRGDPPSSKQRCPEQGQAEEDTEREQVLAVRVAGLAAVAGAVPDPAGLWGNFLPLITADN